MSNIMVRPSLTLKRDANQGIRLVRGHQNNLPARMVDSRKPENIICDGGGGFRPPIPIDYGDGGGGSPSITFRDERKSFVEMVCEFIVESGFALGMSTSNRYNSYQSGWVGIYEGNNYLGLLCVADPRLEYLEKPRCDTYWPFEIYEKGDIPRATQLAKKLINQYGLDGMEIRLKKGTDPMRMKPKQEFTDAGISKRILSLLGSLREFITNPAGE